MKLELKSGDICLLKEERSAQSSVHDWSVRIFPRNTIFEVVKTPNKYGVVLVRPYRAGGKESYKVFQGSLRKLGWLAVLAAQAEA